MESCSTIIYKKIYTKICRKNYIPGSAPGYAPGSKRKTQQDAMIRN